MLTVDDGARLVEFKKELLFIYFILPSVAYDQWLVSRVVSVLDSGAEGRGFKS